ncbi:MAG: hypothetical protein II376_00090 [Clostridia bacterium]|nr:hypothetical protein [Clostridia bacterium]
MIGRKKLRDCVMEDVFGNIYRSNGMFFITDRGGGRYVVFRDMDDDLIRMATVRKRPVGADKIELTVENEDIMDIADEILANEEGLFVFGKEKSFALVEREGQLGYVRGSGQKLRERLDYRVRSGLADKLLWVLNAALNICIVGLVLMAVSTNVGEWLSDRKYGEMYEYLPSFEEYQQKIDEMFAPDGSWSGMGVDERLEAIRYVAEWETVAVLGIPTIEIKAADLEGTTLGQFRNYPLCILMDRGHIEESTPAAVLDTLIHEIRHYWQHETVQLLETVEGENSTMSNNYIFNQAREFRNSFRDYKDVESGEEEDFYEYYSQRVEQDSREWAEYRLQYGIYKEIEGMEEQ